MNAEAIWLAIMAEDGATEDEAREAVRAMLWAEESTQGEEHDRLLAAPDSEHLAHEGVRK